MIYICVPSVKIHALYIALFLFVYLMGLIFYCIDYVGVEALSAVSKKYKTYFHRYLSIIVHINCFYKILDLLNLELYICTTKVCHVCM